jgi:2-phospho-L-lactate guanylyltransferase
MLEDVLECLSKTSGLEKVRVLTDDSEVGRVASLCGAKVRLCAPDPGLNEAVAAATEEARECGFAAAMVVLGDVPLLRPADVEEVCTTGLRAAVVLVPSPDGGTAVLFRRPPDAIPARFGAESLRGHIALARERGIEPVVLDGIPEPCRTDLDTPEDAGRILAEGGPSRTVALLRKLLA